MKHSWDKERVHNSVKQAIAYYWQTRETQKQKQHIGTKTDSGARGAVTGGAQMDGFARFFKEIIESAGIPADCVFTQKALELPGFFRPTKEWDILIVKNKQLIAAIETKSQAGPSFGNNFNNRTEEAMGSALDLWTAFRENKFHNGAQPFLGYFFMLEDCPTSQTPVQVREPHFSVFPEFINASYQKRYEIFCRKLVRERHYTASCLITSSIKHLKTGNFNEPLKDLSVEHFIKTLLATIDIFNH